VQEVTGAHSLADQKTEEHTILKDFPGAEGNTIRYEKRNTADVLMFIRKETRRNENINSTGDGYSVQKTGWWD
jgi:hypothetical protein